MRVDKFTHVPSALERIFDIRKGGQLDPNTWTIAFDQGINDIYSGEGVVEDRLAWIENLPFNQLLINHLKTCYLFGVYQGREL